VAARMYPGAGATTTAEVAAQRQAQLDARGTAVAPDILARSLAHGEQVGTAVMDWADTDGLTAIRALPAYVPPTGVDKWESTPPNFGPAIEPYWGQIRPLALPAADECFPPAPLPFDTDPSSAFYAQAKRVWDINQGLTDEQRMIAMFWRDNPLTSGLPAGHWFIIANQLTDQLGLRLDDAAEMYALLGIALTDAFISCWQGKYVYNLLRPVTYVRRYIDPDWVTWVNTPQFPEYTSGHSVSSQAASVVLSELFGDTTGFTDTHRLQAPSPSAGTRSFSSFSAAALEAATSRLYGGIHFPMGVEAGLEQGTKVGREVLRRVRTRVD
jgi:membrane-associated phospholipid phosphatase